MDKVCKICYKTINPEITHCSDGCKVIATSGVYYYEDDNGDENYCQECGKKHLVYNECIDAYVLVRDYQEDYTDEELKHLKVFDLYYVEDLEPSEDEPDWDAIAKDIRMGL